MNMTENTTPVTEERTTKKLNRKKKQPGKTRADKFSDINIWMYKVYPVLENN